MKRLILILCVAVFSFTHQAKAQWAVLDPSNLIQNIQQVVKSTSTVNNLVNNVKETSKIYEQGKAYYDALKSVNNLIKDTRKVKLTIEMVSEITNIYSSGFSRMASDPNFSMNELEAIALGYAMLLEEGGVLVTELKNVVTSGNGLSLSDKERMDAVAQIYTEMVNYRNLTRYYTDKHIPISYLRSKEKGDTQMVQALYGNPSGRYW